MIDIKTLRAAGLTDSQIVKVLELEQSERQATIREQNRIRQQNHRARHVVTRDQRDIPPHRVKKESTPEEVREVREVRKLTPLKNLEFDEFWQAYPERQGENPKAPARKKFELARRRGVSLEVLLNGARGYAQKVRENKTEPRFIAQAVTWISQERYRDYAEVIESNAELLAEFHRQTLLGRPQ